MRVMSAEHLSPTHQETKIFRLTFERVRYTEGMEIDLANLAKDPQGDFKRVYSQLIPLANENVVNESVKMIRDEFVPEGAMETLLVRNRNGKKVICDEWQTNDPNVVFGIATEDNVKSWYLRNTQKSPLQRLVGIIVK